MSEVKLTGEYHADVNLLTGELAALREELATTDRVLRSSVPEEHKGCASPVGAAQNYIGDLEQRLADAERRNAVMADLLRLIQVSHGTMLLSDPPQDPWKYHQIDAKISAALTKPEEAKS